MTRQRNRHIGTSLDDWFKDESEGTNAAKARLPTASSAAAWLENGGPLQADSGSQADPVSEATDSRPEHRR